MGGSTNISTDQHLTLRTYPNGREIMLLIGNGRVLTRDADNPYIPDGAVAVEGDHILEVGERNVLAAR